MRVEMNKKRLLDQSRSLKVALDGKHQNTKHYQQAWDGHRESKLYNAGLSFQGTNTKIQTLSLQSCSQTLGLQKYYCCIVDGDKCKLQQNINVEEGPLLGMTLNIIVAPAGGGGGAHQLCKPLSRHRPVHEQRVCDF